ncbi:MAG: metallophosphoesterase [Opitutaceae bacterium]|nr:metallophosphoesterase [Opitutaceae bacterium]
MSDPGQTWRFVHATDIHVGSPRSYRFKPALNDNWATAAGQIKALQPDLLLVGGDLTRDGNLNHWEFDDSRATLDAIGVPWHAIPGNMDTGNKHADRQGAWTDRDDVSLNVTEAQLSVFREKIGAFPWSFTHRGVRFSGCYEIIAGTTLPSAAALDTWLDHLATLPRTRWHVMLNHYPLFTDHPAEPARDITRNEDYLNWYFAMDPAPASACSMPTGKPGSPMCSAATSIADARPSRSTVSPSVSAPPPPWPNGPTAGQMATRASAFRSSRLRPRP